MYKDKAKQREANKAAKQRFKLKQAKKNAPALRRMDELGAEGIPVEGIPVGGIPQGIPLGIPKGIPKDDKVIIPVGPGPVIDNMPELPANFGQPDCACLHCRSNKTCGRSPSVETIKAAGLTSDRSNTGSNKTEGSNGQPITPIRPEQLRDQTLMDYLKHTPLEQLEKEGRLFIPNWRRLQG